MNPNQEIQYRDWYEKTPLIKKRLAVINNAEAQAEDPKGKKAPAKKKK